MPAKSESASAKTGPLVELRGVDIAFGRHQVLRNINFSIPRGQTVAVIGESGCGKTVLLKVMIGLVKPKRGEVRFDGQNLATLNDQELTKARTRYGFVFQQAALFDSMTIGQNVAFPLRQHTQTDAQHLHEIVIARLAPSDCPRA